MNPARSRRTRIGTSDESKAVIGLASSRKLHYAGSVASGVSPSPAEAVPGAVQIPTRIPTGNRL